MQAKKQAFFKRFFKHKKRRRPQVATPGQRRLLSGANRSHPPSNLILPYFSLDVQRPRGFLRVVPESHGRSFTRSGDRSLKQLHSSLMERSPTKRRAASLPPPALRDRPGDSPWPRGRLHDPTALFGLQPYRSPCRRRGCLCWWLFLCGRWSWCWSRRWSRRWSDPPRHLPSQRSRDKGYSGCAEFAWKGRPHLKEKVC